MTARGLRVIAIGTGLVALASVSLNSGRTLRVVDANGAPVRTVLVIYHHEGGRPNPVHPVTYQASGRSVVESDTDGRVHIPMSVHAHWPFPIETNPRLVVDLVYAPPLHNRLATIYDRQISPPGAFLVEDDLATVRLSNCSLRASRCGATWPDACSHVTSSASHGTPEQETTFVLCGSRKITLPQFCNSACGIRDARSWARSPAPECWPIPVPEPAQQVAAVLPNDPARHSR